ncbi:MAG: hypothetical protein P1U34_11410 [Coxiellaceae bacterium]|nr:hypothetical protein [Coxiellaceae bacterium]
MSRLEIPARFRILPCKFLPSEFEYDIAGMNHPCYVDGIKRDGAAYLHIRQLKRMGFGVIISLDNNKDDLAEVQAACAENQVAHVVYPIADWAAPTIDQFMELQSQILSFKQKVALHCKAGVGRTGTQLSGLVLRALLQRLMVSPSVGRAGLIESLLLDSFVEPSCDPSSSSGDSEELVLPYTVRCTSLVAQSILLVRDLKSPLGGAVSVGSVETADEIKALCRLQEAILAPSFIVGADGVGLFSSAVSGGGGNLEPVSTLSPSLSSV